MSLGVELVGVWLVGRLAPAVGVGALLTGVFLLAASSVEREVGRVLAEFGLVDPAAGWV